MSPEAWRQAKHIFEQALDQESGARDAFIRQSCAGDPALYEEVASLLASHEEAGDAFLSPLIEASDTDRMEGRQLGPYRILHRIGHGGMGAVYLAERADEQFRRRVALKLVRPGLDDGQLMRRFHNERQMLAVLDHPDIVRLLDAGVTSDGIPYFVMDYVEGQPIDEFCQARALSIPERLELFRKVCAAVHYAHRNLVVHRDLKPSNILVTPEGEPKLLDFGIAKLLRPEYGTGAIGLTRTMQPMTPEYASPEQMSGQPITTSSDVYSLGVLLYRLVTGRHPYEMNTTSAAEMERIVRETNPQRPSAAAPAGPGGERVRASDIDNIVLMAMRKEPQRRYPSAEHLAEDIRRYLAKEPVAARPDTLLYRTTKFVSRNRLGVGASVLALLALVATSVEIWRLKEESDLRYAQLRDSASFMLFDLDKELKKGPTPARKALVTEAVKEFDGMAKDARNDDDLKAQTADGYHKIGDIQGNPEQSNLGDFDGAAESYRKELELGNAMKPGDKRSFVVQRAHVELGRLAAFNGSRKEAMQHFQAARSTLENAGDSLKVKQGLRSLWQELGIVQQNFGDIQAASQCFAKSLDYARQVDRAASTPKSHADIVQESFLVGYAMARTGRAEESLAVTRGALEMAQRTAAADPSRRRDVAQLSGLLGYVQDRAGRPEEALAAYEDSAKIFDELAEKDPHNQQTRIDLGQTLGEMANVLWEIHRDAEAHDASSKALQALKEIVDTGNASPYVLVSYAGFLLAPANPHRDNLAALLCVKKADAAEKPANPDTQEILAHAYAATGAAASARDVAQRTLQSLPAGADPVLKQKLEEWLNTLTPVARFPSAPPRQVPESQKRWWKNQ
jgi:serine/threonine protein kinase